MSYGKVVILLGPPGAGKGTQAKRLADKTDFTHVSTGELLREAVREQTEIGQKAQEIMDRGELVPDKMISQVVAEKFRSGDAGEGIILDGYPRNAAQARHLAGFLDGAAVCAVNIRLPDEQVVKRISGRRVAPGSGKVYNIYFSPSAKGDFCEVSGEKLVQREDDREEVVRNRLRVYHEQTRPLVDHYRVKGGLHEVDGSQPIDLVAEEVLEAVREELGEV